jgi:DNA-binding GntR family transcriptional regulator
MMNKKDEIYDFLVDRLVGARYAFGERILVKELAAETGVSRQPIMTALNRLAADGFVRIVPQVGCQVVSPAPSEIADFFLMFQRMEGLLAELAAVRRSEEQLLELKRVQRRIVQLEEEGEALGREYSALNRSFHQLLHVMARSPLLDARQRANFNISDFFINHSIGFDRLQPGSAQEHEAIIQALERRSPDRARAVMEVHIGSVGDAVLSALEATASET